MLSHSTQKHKCFLLNGNCFLCANNNSVEKDSPARTECLCISESQYGVGFVHSDFKTNTNASRPQPLRVCVCAVALAANRILLLLVLFCFESMKQTTLFLYYQIRVYLFECNIIVVRCRSDTQWVDCIDL